MIKFENINNEIPFMLFKSFYEKALLAGQKNIEAISISSFNTKAGEVESRFVNLKFVHNQEFIFFTNYNSPKANSFLMHDQIATLIYWSEINTQIRMKAQIKKTSNEFNQEYFVSRSKEKNALAISSNQSMQIGSFDMVKNNFMKSFKNDDLKKCPSHWGGYTFTPYEIEFWQGNEFRLNKRDLYKKNTNKWDHFILQP